MKVSQIKPAGIYLVIVNNSSNGRRCEIRSKLTTKTPKRRRRFVVFFVNFKHISHLVLVVLLLTSNIYWPVVPAFCYHFTDFGFSFLFPPGFADFFSKKNLFEAVISKEADCKRLNQAMVFIWFTPEFEIL